MQAFFEIRAVDGVTWVTTGADGKMVGALAKGALTDFEAAVTAAGCTTLVARQVREKVAALQRKGYFAGRTDLALVELEDLGLAPAADADALGAFARYLGWGAALWRGVLPDGCGPSPEQWTVLRAFEKGSNVLCRAVAGAGKTTTLLLCVRRRPAATCLLLTYNKRLQLEVARTAKTALAGTGRIDVATYHSAAGRAYGCVIHDDEAFRVAVRTPPPLAPRFDVLMLDEAQDLSVEYSAFVRHLLRECPQAQVVVVGDELQAINEYRGAYPEFLTEAPHLFETVYPQTNACSGAGPGAARPRAWADCPLSTSYRLTPYTAAFVNAHLYRRPVVVGGNTRDANRKPRYAAAKGLKGVTETLAREVLSAVAEFGPEGVFVLAASTRGLRSSNSPLGALVCHHLSRVPTYVAGNDDEAVNSELIRGKLAILSFNAVKGCERPCVVVVGLDETHFRYYDRAWSCEEEGVPNVLTVAATRASAFLVVVADAKSTLRTVNVATLDLSAELKGSPGRPTVAKPKKSKRPHMISVVNLLRHQHPESVRRAMARVHVLPAEKIQTPFVSAPQAKIRFGKLTEDLGFVYGTVGPILAEVATTGASLFGEGLAAPVVVGKNDKTRLEDPYACVITEDEFAAYPPLYWEEVSTAVLTECEARTAGDWCRIAVARHAVEEGRHHIARQVTDYDWVDGRALEGARDTVLNALRGRLGEFEMVLPAVLAGDKNVCGRADHVDADGFVWEFKFTSELREEHTLQLACYLALLGGGEGYVLALLSGERRKVAVLPEDALPLLCILAEKARAQYTNIFAVIDRFDAETAAEAIPDTEDTTGGMEVEAERAHNQWTADDIYDF